MLPQVLILGNGRGAVLLLIRHKIVMWHRVPGFDTMLCHNIASFWINDETTAMLK
jgi:hypothetical protein